MSYNKNNSLVKIGIVGEHLIKYFLCNMNGETFIKFNHDYKFDIQTHKGKYEIKTDTKYIKYNSFFCEFMSNNKPSGINTTESDYYIFIGPSNEKFETNYIFFIETNQLKKLIEENNFLKKNAPCKDHYNNVYSINNGYIIPKMNLLKFSSQHIINKVNYEDLHEIIQNLV